MGLDKYEKLKELKKLLDDNLITQDEFQELKKDVFNGIEKQLDDSLTNIKIKNRTSTKMITYFIACILLIVGSYYIFNFAKNKNLNSISKSKPTEFKVVEEFDKINSSINSKLTDSISNTYNDYDYTYWYKDGKVIKLSVFFTDYNDFSTAEDYYFKDNNYVFAYRIKDVNLADNRNYTALIYFNDSSIVKEDYLVKDMNSENSKDIKKTKRLFENYLKERGLSIKDISQDVKTKKSIGLLTLSELSNRYSFDYKNLRNNNSQSQNTNSYDSNSMKQFRDIQITLMDASLKKAKIYLGEPDKYEYAFGHISKGFALYYNIVANQNGSPKHLVLFLRMNGNQWGDDAMVEEIYEVDDYEKACFGIHCIEIKNRTIYTNALGLIDKGYNSLN